jgi:hypothetical protein
MTSLDDRQINQISATLQRRRSNKEEPMLRYSVSVRSGLQREYSLKAEAIAHAKLEAADGWPTRVRDMTTNQIIWSDDGQMSRPQS